MTPKISIVVPIYDMKNGEFFLWRLVNSLTDQTFKDWELIITKDGKMAENTNAGIKKARGEYIKILYLDDYLSNQDALMKMLEGFFTHGYEWIMVGADNNRFPEWTENIESGNNRLGSPSALIFKNHFEDNLLFDERMSWLLDCDYYKRMRDKFGSPGILTGDWVTLGVGDHQMTNILTDEEKLAEHNYMKQKYE